jgi:hypothetical protein
LSAAQYPAPLRALNLIRRLLLLPLLAPLLAVLVAGALNTRSTMVLRMLTWQSPSLPLGAWIAAAAAGGGALSAAGTALALRDPGPGLRRRVRREPEREELWEGSAANPWGPAWRGERPGSARPGAGNDQRGRAAESEPNGHPREISEPPAWQQPATAGPDRAPGEPPPTLSVPYRVIRRGRPESPSAAKGSAAPWPQEQWSTRSGWEADRQTERRPEPVPASDDWGSETLEDW